MDAPTEAQQLALENIYEAACRWLGRRSNEVRLETATRPEMSGDLLQHFGEEMWRLYREPAKRLGYNATYFRELLEDRGPVETAVFLAGAPGHHEGLTTLYELGALNLSVEALILRDPWCHYFEPKTLAAARKKLAALGYSE